MVRDLVLRMNEEKPICRFLRVGHPQYQPEEGYVSLIADWIRGASISSY